MKTNTSNCFSFKVPLNFFLRHLKNYFVADHIDEYDFSSIFCNVLGLENSPILVHHQVQAHRRGGSRGSNESPLEVNNEGLKTQTVDFQLLANSGGMENKL